MVVILSRCDFGGSAMKEVHQYLCDTCGVEMQVTHSINDGWGQFVTYFKCPKCGETGSKAVDDPNGPQHQPGFKGWR